MTQQETASEPQKCKNQALHFALPSKNMEWKPVLAGIGKGAAEQGTLELCLP